MSAEQPAFDIFPEDPQGGRREFDRYLTPGWMVRALMKRVSFDNYTILEPCVGDHAIAQFFDQGRLITNDLDERCRADYHLDATGELWDEVIGPAGGVDITPSNPPFNEAFEIIQHALKHSRIGVAMLLRITWKEPTKVRGPWLKRHPPQCEIVMPRWNFRGDGPGDSATTSWLLWGNDPAWLKDVPAFSFVDDAEMNQLIALEQRLAWEGAR
jgi:hypothetical protein